jgi:DNA processing protein
LSDAVVVVRAALRSGALITAAQAGARGTKVYAVPGDPSNWRAEGSNALLRDGQALVATGPIDLLTDLGWPIPQILVSTAATQTGAPASYTAEPDRTVVDAAGVKLWQLLDGRTPAHVDDLALRAQIPAREALGKLAELELKGMAVQRPGKYFLRR